MLFSLYSCRPGAPTFIADRECHVQLQRREKPRSAIASAHVVQPDGQVIVGSRMAVSDPDGWPQAYVLVAPNHADARPGRISPDTPLGRRAGDEVDVATSAGTRRAAPLILGALLLMTQPLHWLIDATHQLTGA
jgi:hypothetical protein